MLKRLISIAYSLEVGLLLVLIPWSTFWDRNYFADLMPLLREALANPFVRGGVSGLGLLNLCIGVADLGALMSLRRGSTRSSAI